GGGRLRRAWRPSGGDRGLPACAGRRVAGGAGCGRRGAWACGAVVRGAPPGGARRGRPVSRRARYRPAAVMALGLVLAPAAAAGAGGPLVIATDGSAVGWDTRAPIAYFTDQGPLGQLANPDAVGLVGAMFGTWQSVPTAAIAFARAGALPVDVGSGNFGPF